MTMENRSIPMPQMATSVLATNKVIRNTYTLLSLTLAFSALVAGMAMALNLPRPGIFVFLIGAYGLMFLTSYLRNSVWGIASVFAFTGFMGYSLGQILSHYLSMPGGSMIVMQALGGTAVAFLGLSAYALVTRKDFSFMSGFLFVGILVAFVAALAAYFLSMPALALGVSAMFVLLMSGIILYQTSEIIHGGETNYIMATVTLYVAIYNMFTSLLHLLGFANSD